MPARADVPEGTGLDRIEGETKLVHRGLVLYAMQDEKRRSIRAVSKGVQRTEGAVRGWAKKWRWQQRIEAEGLTVQARACQLYRDLYHAEWRLRDVAGPVEQRMSVPVLATSPPPRGARPREGEGQVIAEAKLAAERHQPPQAEPDNVRAVRNLRLMLGITEAGIRIFAEKLRGPEKDRPVVTVADAVRLIREHREISEALGDLDLPTAAPVATETSFRVREAERTGRNVTEALLEDVNELQAILLSIRDAEERDPAWLDPSDAQGAQRQKTAAEDEDGEIAEG